MAQAKILWDKEDYRSVEKVLRKAVEFCEDHDTWKINVAHVLFMQGNRHAEAIGFYESVVNKYYGNVSHVKIISPNSFISTIRRN